MEIKSINKWNKMSTEWIDEPIEVIRDGKCPCVNMTHEVDIEKKAYIQIVTLCQKYPKLEWIAGIEGYQTDEKTIIKSIILFEQKVTSSHCEYTPEGQIEKAKVKLVGWIHSHNNMDVFFSEEDYKTASQNSLSLCVNNRLQFFGKYLIKSKCGYLALVNIKITCQLEIDHDIIAQAEKLIKKDVIEYTLMSDSNQNGDYNECIYCQKVVALKNIVRLDMGQVAHKKCHRYSWYSTSNVDADEDEEIGYLDF